MIWLFLASVAATELPKAPAPVAPLPGECANAYPLQEGAEFPAALLDGQVVSCSGVLIPTSRLAGLMIWEEHAQLVRQLYAVETSAMKSDLQAATLRIAELETPPAWWDKPRTQRWVGVASGVVLGSAATVVALNQWNK